MRGKAPKRGRPPVKPQRNGGEVERKNPPMESDTRGERDLGGPPHPPGRYKKRPPCEPIFSRGTTFKHARGNRVRHGGPPPQGVLGEPLLGNPWEYPQGVNGRRG